MNVLDVLSTIEKEQNIRILFACEAGSRAYGMSQVDSDYDIRFIYIQPIKSYLSLGNAKETYTLIKGGLDIQGWDIRKALLLAHKSNASLFEWALSSIPYVRDDLFSSYFLEEVYPSFSIKVLAYHYLSLTTKNVAQFKEKQKINFLYHAVRCALMLELLVEQKVTSIQLAQLTKQSNYFSESDYCLLKQWKQQGAVSNELASSLLQKIIQVIEATSPQLQGLITSKPHIKALEKLFHELLEVD
ncbi:nucleotidyltransferase domain-containing protein [Bacillus sp. FJAT-45066]|uniref:nucleotidyltransferase domain-containing protein n=1 Tax=Bacillus sp. FJAT-45066 TaxID=2011010 RepID=UPI000BB788D2|nr:nucleotidyltransferase domain-containing protein [Bacillus sp. FJAT-45066]